ncbi:MAG: hypothetical protein IKN38_00090 [Clostridia bacterium]|nr:hypothetical protein [Clostridia bacterium]
MRDGGRITGTLTEDASLDTAVTRTEGNASETHGVPIRFNTSHENNP